MEIIVQLIIVTVSKGKIVTNPVLRNINNDIMSNVLLSFLTNKIPIYAP